MKIKRSVRTEKKLIGFQNFLRKHKESVKVGEGINVSKLTGKIIVFGSLK